MIPFREFVCNIRIGHVMKVHLDTSRPEDDEKISDLLNLSEVEIADRCEMRGCSVLQWRAQLEGSRLKKSHDSKLFFIKPKV